jgi:hypothetical protein
MLLKLFASQAKASRHLANKLSLDGGALRRWALGTSRPSRPAGVRWREMQDLTPINSPEDRSQGQAGVRTAGNSTYWCLTLGSRSPRPDDFFFP